MIRVKKQVRRGATPPLGPPLPSPPSSSSCPGLVHSRPVQEGLGSGGAPFHSVFRVKHTYRGSCFPSWAACGQRLPSPAVSPWQIWVGGTGASQGKSKGKIYVIDAERKTVEKELVAHMDTVKTLCSAEDRYVLSGSGRGEGKIAIWKVE